VHSTWQEKYILSASMYINTYGWSMYVCT
jgi:hypothetical protein